LKQKLAAIEKLQITQEVLSEKAQEMRKLAVDLKPTLAKILDQTKILQKDVGFF
jgi:signal transduction histidine kinase